MKESAVLGGNSEYLTTLMKYLDPVQASDKKWVRCYQATEHKCNGSKFHELCDNKGPTVTLIRVNENVFGGYADKSWTRSSKNLGTKYNFPAFNVFLR